MLNVSVKTFTTRSCPNPVLLGILWGLSTINPRRKCIVVAYPLCDNILVRHRHSYLLGALSR